MKHLLFFTFLLAACPSLWASATDDLEEGNRFYTQGDFAAAVEAYQKVEEGGNYSFSLFFNRGNAHFKQKDWAQAILYYERALRIRPGRKKVIENLQQAQLNLKDNFPFRSTYALEDIWKRSIAFFSPWGWAGLGLFLLWGAGGLTIWLRSRRRTISGGLVRMAVAVVGVSLLLFLIAGFRHHQLCRSDFAIVMTAKTPLRQGPDEISPAVGELYVGNKVKFLEEIGTWKQVLLGDGRKGWIPSETLENINWCP
jgi:tetratricopeptide (TPR) repeat protein